MVFFAVVVTMLITFWVLAYFEAPFWGWSIVLVLCLLSLEMLGLNATLCLVLWPVLILLLCVFNIQSLRKRFVSAFLFSQFKNKLPSMSSTEREAIQAGDVWWEAELFQGRLNWDHILSTIRQGLRNWAPW